MNLKKLVKKEMFKLPPEVEKRNDAEEVQITTKFKDDHFHFIMNDDNEIVREFVEAQAVEIGLELYGNKDKEPPDQIVFKNRQAIGDILTFTSGVRDFKKAFPNTKVGVISTAMHIWDHNPYIDHNFRNNRHILDTGPGYLTNKSNSSDLHMCNAFRIDMENKLGLRIPQGPITPDIWMTEEEYKAPPLIDGPYWLFVYGGEPGWPCKQYHRWQEVINLLKDDIQIVQIGVSKHPYPILDNVINYIGRTEDKNLGIRHLFNLFLHAQGTLGLVSMHMHLSAAFGNPCVVVAGAREPASFTQYFGQQYIQTNGTMFCGEHTACWKCELKGCKNLTKPNNINVGHHITQVPKCVEIIEPEEIAASVRKYYKGGRLEYGNKIPNKFFKNIVKEAKVFIAPKVEEVDEKLIGKFGFKWGGDSVTDQDWLFMKEVFKEDKIKNVLEFGCGLSTLLMGTVVDKVVSYGTNDNWNTKVRGMVDPKKHDIVYWDGKTVPAKEGVKYPLPKYDLAFVDGPSGGENREWSMQFASEHANRIIVHDAGRVPERKWQAKYLNAEFEMVSKGGHRCHYWIRKNLIKPQVLIEDLKDGKPTAKMVTTCRGYGGSERSTINIMQMLLDRGYNVELVSTSNISGEYGRNIPKGVLIAKDFSRVMNPCDLMILYASDTIWSYNEDKYTSTMSNVKAKRKVMVLNFKLGGAGQVEWTKGWDKYLFLNSTHEGDLIKRMPDIKSSVMAPPTPLDQYFENTVDYSFPLKLIRHSSQGDNKYRTDTNSMITGIWKLSSDIQFHFMPSYSQCMDHPQIYKYPKNKPPVWEFLRKGNLFWYPLPDDYTEGGPKVIMEAMASGLAVIADNHSGPKDRITEETGWLCDTWVEYLEVIKYVLNNPNSIMEKGLAAREYAKKYFIEERWIDEIISDNPDSSGT